MELALLCDSSSPVTRQMVLECKEEGIPIVVYSGDEQTVLPDNKRFVAVVDALYADFLAFCEEHEIPIIVFNPTPASTPPINISVPVILITSVMSVKDIGKIKF